MKRQTTYHTGNNILLPILISALLMFSACTIVFAQSADESTQALTNVTDEAGLTILNDKLRALNDRISGFSNQLIDGSQIIGLNNVPSSSGALPIANGGTAATTSQAAMTNLLPDQSGHAGEFLTTDGSIYSWASLPTQYLNLVQTQSSTSTGTITFTFSGLSDTKVYKLIMRGEAIYQLFINSESAGSVYRRGTEVTASTNSTEIPFSDASDMLEVTINNVWRENGGGKKGIQVLGNYGKNSTGNFINQGIYYLFGNGNAEDPTSNLSLSSIICKFNVDYTGKTVYASLYELVY